MVNRRANLQLIKTHIMIYALSDSRPVFNESNFIAPSADLVGSVILKKNASVWFNCVLRADNDTITVGENSNIQDACILHVDPGFPLDIGPNVTVGHKVMLHGCSIGEGSLIGMNAVVLNGAKIGKHCLIGANALVTENMVVPDGMMVLGSPGKVVKPLSDAVKASMMNSAKHYVENGQRFKTSLTVVEPE